MAEVVLYGAGGHAKVIIDILERSGIHHIVGLVDDTAPEGRLMGYPVASDLRQYLDRGIRAGLVAVGDNWQRHRIVTQIQQWCESFTFVTAIHPSVQLGKEVTVAEGTVIMAGGMLNPCVQIGRHCILNTGSIVDHDCTLHEYASIAPGVTLGGNVVVGAYTAIGLGASVIQKMTIGAYTVVGAGSVVVRPIPSECVSFGTPCRVVRKRAVDEPYL